jgi:hypothetical protein
MPVMVSTIPPIRCERPDSSAIAIVMSSDAAAT